MKPKASLFFSLLILSGCTVVNAAEQAKKVHEDLLRKVQEKGTVRVIVELDVAVDPHKKLTPAEELAQRNTIAAAQKEIVASLLGTKHKIYMQDDRIRGLAMEAGLDALSVLEKSPRVARVYEDYPLSPKRELKEIRPIVEPWKK